MKTNETEFRIGHRGDALSLLKEMIAKCEAIEAGSPPAFRKNKPIGSTGYFLPRLASLLDAAERGII